MDNMSSQFRILFSNLSPCPLPLIREGGTQVRERRSLSSNVLPPLLLKERGIKGVRLINNLFNLIDSTGVQL
jgi:hypothetical protein